jgi:hypothetical protein
VNQDRNTRPTAIEAANRAALDALPPPNTKRWVIRRKAEVVGAVRNGVLTLEAACERYSISLEELLSWQRLIESHGLAGLRVTRLQDYRAAAAASRERANAESAGGRVDRPTPQTHRLALRSGS